MEVQLKTNRKRKEMSHENSSYSNCISQKNESNVIIDNFHRQHIRVNEVGSKNRINVSNLIYVSDSDDDLPSDKRLRQCNLYMKNDVGMRHYSISPTVSSQSYVQSSQLKIIKPLYKPILCQNKNRAKCQFLHTSFQEGIDSHELKIMHVDYSKISVSQKSEYLNVTSQIKPPDRTQLMSQEDLRVATLLADILSKE